MQPVDSVELSKYAGLWYEIARLPNRFQRSCERNVTAEYTLREDGKITVINKCIKADGETIQANGVAKVGDTTSNAKLKVNFVSLFGIRLFWGNYWIIGLDENYQFAIIGEPNRKYGWVLARNSQLAEEKIVQANAILKIPGSNPDDFIRTIQASK